MKKLSLRLVGQATVLVLCFCRPVEASVIATVATNNLGSGEFQYDFAIDNRTGTVPIAGLLIEGGGTIFSLDLSSAVGAPAGWDFLSPLPPFDDLLSYFALATVSNIPIGGSLGGFTFQSTRNPSTLAGIDVVLVGSDSSQVPYRITPEPATVAMVFLAAGAVILDRRFLRSTRPTSVSSDEADLAGANPHP
jgi:hypothetical protein